jgi:transcriptional regulator with XRE-family HTH domain
VTREQDFERLSLSDRIDRLIEERAKGNRAEFARQLGTTRETVSRWLGGQRPGRDYAEALAELAELPLELFWDPPVREVRLDRRSENALRLIVRDEVERQLLPMKREMAALKGRMTRLGDSVTDESHQRKRGAA